MIVLLGRELLYILYIIINNRILLIIKNILINIRINGYLFISIKFANIIKKYLIVKIIIGFAAC